MFPILYYFRYQVPPQFWIMSSRGEGHWRKNWAMSAIYLCWLMIGHYTTILGLIIHELGIPEFLTHKWRFPMSWRYTFTCWMVHGKSHLSMDDIWGYPHHQVSLVLVYLDQCTDFQKQLPEEVQQEIAKGAGGEFANFPIYKTRLGCRLRKQRGVFCRFSARCKVYG